MTYGIPNKRAALAYVARAVAAHLAASSVEDLTGIPPGVLTMTPAEQRRLEAAMDLVETRLWAMAERNSTSVEGP